MHRYTYRTSYGDFVTVAADARQALAQLGALILRAGAPVAFPQTTALSVEAVG